LPPMHVGWRTERMRRRLIGLALCALLATQWIALLHSVGHGRAALDGAAPPAGSVLQLALGHDEGSPSCHLFDQLAHGAPALDVAMPAIGSLSEPKADAAIVAAVPCGTPNGYLARAPPLPAA